MAYLYIYIYIYTYSYMHIHTWHLLFGLNLDSLSFSLARLPGTLEAEGVPAGLGAHPVEQLRFRGCPDPGAASWLPSMRGWMWMT